MYLSTNIKHKTLLVSSDYELNQNENDILIYSNYIVSGLSLFGGIYVIASFIIKKKTKSFMCRLILGLCLSDFTYTICNFISNLTEIHSTLCKIEGFFREFAIISSITWAVIISRALNLKSIQNTGNTPKLFRNYTIISLIIPLLFAIM